MDINKFLSKYEVIETGCWVWIGYRCKEGFARYNVLINGERKKLLVQRIMYELKIGPIPEGFRIYRTCNNITCVNPDHFILKPFSTHLKIHSNHSLHPNPKNR